MVFLISNAVSDNYFGLGYPSEAIFFVARLYQYKKICSNSEYFSKLLAFECYDKLQSYFA